MGLALHHDVVPSWTRRRLTTTPPARGTFGGCCVNAPRDAHGTRGHLRQQRGHLGRTLPARSGGAATERAPRPLVQHALVLGGVPEALRLLEGLVRHLVFAAQGDPSEQPVVFKVGAARRFRHGSGGDMGHCGTVCTRAGHHARAHIRRHTSASSKQPRMPQENAVAARRLRRGPAAGESAVAHAKFARGTHDGNVRRACRPQHPAGAGPRPFRSASGTGAWGKTSRGRRTPRQGWPRLTRRTRWGRRRPPR